MQQIASSDFLLLYTVFKQLQNGSLMLYSGSLFSSSTCHIAVHPVHVTLQYIQYMSHCSTSSTSHCSTSSTCHIAVHPVHVTLQYIQYMSHCSTSSTCHIIVHPVHVTLPITGAGPSLRGPPRQWFGHTTINPWTSAITLLLYTFSHILEIFWIILGVVLGPIKPPKDIFWQFIPAENSLIIYVTMPIAIATDQ